MGEGYFQRNLRVRQLEAGYNGCVFLGGGGGVVGLNFLSLMVNVNSRLTRENANYFLENHPPPLSISDYAKRSS